MVIARCFADIGYRHHHSRFPEQTDTNYGNLFSFWDLLFGTFTPSHLGRDVRYGLEGFDDPALQTTTALLALPFRKSARPEEPLYSNGTARRCAD